MVYAQDYKYLLCYAGIIQTIGIGLQTLWSATSTMQDWMGFQVPTVIGLGFFFSLLVPAIQSNLPKLWSLLLHLLRCS